MSYMFFLGGYIIGGIFGYFLAALMFISKKEDEIQNSDQIEK